MTALGPTLQKPSRLPVMNSNGMFSAPTMLLLLCQIITDFAQRSTICETSNSIPNRISDLVRSCPSIGFSCNRFRGMAFTNSLQYERRSATTTPDSLRRLKLSRAKKQHKMEEKHYDMCSNLISNPKSQTDSDFEFMNNELAVCQSHTLYAEKGY